MQLLQIRLGAEGRAEGHERARRVVLATVEAVVDEVLDAPAQRLGERRVASVAATMARLERCPMTARHSAWSTATPPE